VFFSAGLSTQRAWAEVAATENSEVSDRIARAHTQGSQHSAVVSREVAGESLAWRSVAAVISTAALSGAPLAEVLWRFGVSLRATHQLQRQLDTVARAPLLTVGVLVLLPLLGVGVAGLLGVDALGFLVHTGLGRVSSAAAVVLVVAAVIWMVRIIRHASPPPGDRGLALELLSVASRGGALPERAQAMVEQVWHEHDLGEWDESAMQEMTQLSRRVGVPISSLSTHEAQWSRERVQLDAEQAHQTVSVALLVPLGLLILPAFVMVGVVPVVVTLLGDAVGAAPVPW
jgi:tight adherence protein B